MLSAQQRQTLNAAKRLPLALLVCVALGFAASSVAAARWPQVPLWLACIKAVTEAALVGALADWFAVSALFRRIPLPLVGRHTAIIPRNKDRIGQNLAHFVRDKFLDGPSLMALIERHDPARALAGWLTAPANSALLGRQVARLALAALEMVQDRQVERFLSQSFKALLAHVDLPRAAADLLSGLTRDGHHQAVLDDVLARVSAVLRESETHVLIARTIVLWLKREHPLKEKMLPTDWLGEKGASAIAAALDSLLQDIASDPGHHMRQAFDASVQQWIARLHSDPAMAGRAERLRHYLLHDEKLASYLRALWLGLRARLQADLANEHSQVARKTAAMGRWLGQSLAHDEALRHSMNERLKRWAQALAPDVSQFLAQHIADTVRRWDARELSELIELHIGKDLQYIRINGTLVGGAVGLLLFVVSNVGRLWP
ncbi:DUF445 domain-containing protein [Delftia sp. PS-11]|uniref:DUF445 domain-containing protein n=1 Tax=Delftia sp. PS-11 TaxID=2767222 RepID=UPI0024574291|nr:DUF445 domain-containing protein [Delftia sp. PS-11]KAJ8743477.1 DUF445 domain-containing protein [Delftia sp. PS-11]